MRKIIIVFGLVLFTNCGGSEESTGDIINGEEYSYFFSGKINGEPFIYGQKLGSTSQTYMNSTSNSLISTCTSSQQNGLNYNAGIYPSFDDTLPTLDIEFVKLYLCSNTMSQSEVFNDLFIVKNYDLATSNSNNQSGTTGAAGMYYSPNAQSGPYYNTYLGDQSGSSIEITKSTNSNLLLQGQLVEARQTIEGNFSVKFYNVNDLSDVVEITDGQFKIVQVL